MRGLPPVDLGLLSARPGWWVPRALFAPSPLSLGAWGLLPAVSGIVAGMGDHMDPSLSVRLSLDEFLGEVSLEALYVALTSLGLWLLSLGVDKLDQLVWLNTSDADRKAIYHRRLRRYVDAGSVDDGRLR